MTNVTIIYQQSDCNANVCVGGKTQLAPGWEKDDCGVCRGSNTCTDCAGVVNGEKVLDSCGRCLLPSDEKFNSCPDITDVDVRAIPGNKATLLVLKVAGMKKRVNCSLKGDSRRYAM